jgi:hypothetical protein
VDRPAANEIFDHFNLISISLSAAVAAYLLWKMTEESRKLESVRFAQESTKQIITLCTAIVTFIFGAVSVGAVTLHGNAFWFTLCIIVLLSLSILAGMFTLFALSGILASVKLFASENPLNSAHYSRFGRLQFFTFAGAVCLISLFILLWPEKNDGKIEIAVPKGVSCSLVNSKFTCDAVRW